MALALVLVGVLIGVKLHSSVIPRDVGLWVVLRRDGDGKDVGYVGTVRTGTAPERAAP